MKEKQVEKELWAREKDLLQFISNKDINYFIKIVKSLEDLGILSDGVAETVRHEIKEQEDKIVGALLAHLAASIV